MSIAADLGAPEPSKRFVSLYNKKDILRQIDGEYLCGKLA